MWSMILILRSGRIFIPFVITEIKPIQLSSFDNSKLINKRKEFTKNEWLDIILRSCGYEPSAEGDFRAYQNALAVTLIADG